MVVREMLQVKYGVALDPQDFMQKLEEHCCFLGIGSEPGCRGGRGAGPVSLEPTPTMLAARLNAWPDLRFRTRGGELALAMRLDYRELGVDSCGSASGSFQELMREVRRMPGTPRAVAVLCPRVPAADSAAGVADPSGPSRGTAKAAAARGRAVAVFRQDYVQPGALVGRCSLPFSEPLVSFKAEDLLSALVVEPHVVAAYRQHAGGATRDTVGQASTLPLREEYVGLGGWLLPQEGRRQTAPAGHEVSPVAAHSVWREAPLVVLPERSDLTDSCVGSPNSLSGSPAAGGLNQRWMRNLRRALEQGSNPAQEASAGPEGAEPPLTLLLQLNAWLEARTSDTAAAARRALVDSGLAPALVESVRRAGASGTRERTELAIAVQACRAIGLSAQQFPDGAAAYAVTSATSAICGLMRRWLTDGEVQASAALALRELLEEDAESGAVVAEAISGGAPRLLRAAIAAHPQLVDLHRNASRAAQLLAEPLDAAAGSSESSSVPGSNSATGEEQTSGVRRDLAAALKERRAAEAARPGVVNQAMGWLFSGGRTPPVAASASVLSGRSVQRQGASEPPGSRGPAVPAPCVPAPTAAAFRPVGPISRTASNGIAVGSAGSSSSAVAPRRQTSRPCARAPATVAVRETIDSSPQDDSPHTPPAVRLRRRLEAAAAAEGLASQ